MGTKGNINIYDNFNFCTTLEQSKQLLELGLNPETSDMTYLTGIRDGEEEIYGILPYKNLEPDCRKGDILYKNIPAWTYYKLLTILPKEYLLLSHRNIGIKVLSDIIKHEILNGGIDKEFLINKDNNTVKKVEKTWHRLNEKLPPDMELVLVRLRRYNYIPKVMYYKENDNTWVEDNGKYSDWYAIKDDLWMSIPDTEDEIELNEKERNS